MTSIRTSLPGDEYRLNVPPAVAADARLFAGRYALLDHVRSLLPPSPTVCEVGVYQGYFSEKLLATLSPSRLHLIDTFSVADGVTGKFTAADHHAFILAKFASEPAVRVHRGLSWDQVAALDDASLDFAYVDADHTFAGVRADIAALVPKMKPGGIMQFNDYCNYSCHENHVYGVLHAVNEFIENAAGRVTLVGMSLERGGNHDLAVRVGVSAGAEAPQKLTLVTPCSRPQNLEKVKASIDFARIDKWIIVYDVRNPTDRGLPSPSASRYGGHPQIVEMNCDRPGVVGNPGRNAALDIVREGLVYFVDDDNAVHPDFWKLDLQAGRINTWDMAYSDGRVLTGNTLVINGIDTAQFAFDVSLVRGLRFNVDQYNADGAFVESLHAANPGSNAYFPGVHAYYNRLSW